MVVRAGDRIGDGKNIDLVRYVAWLAQEHHTPTKWGTVYTGVLGFINTSHT
jgi:hypothetical protein